MRKLTFNRTLPVAVVSALVLGSLMAAPQAATAALTCEANFKLTSTYCESVAVGNTLTLTVPSGVNSIQVVMQAAGGGGGAGGAHDNGGGSISLYSGGGGGTGGWAGSTFSVGTGDVVTFTAGTGGAAGTVSQTSSTEWTGTNGGDGGDDVVTVFDGSTTSTIVTAHGGKGGKSGTNGGAGGDSGDGTHSGGAGYNNTPGSTHSAGGGGGGISSNGIAGAFNKGGDGGDTAYLYPQSLTGSNALFPYFSSYAYPANYFYNGQPYVSLGNWTGIGGGGAVVSDACGISTNMGRGGRINLTSSPSYVGFASCHTISSNNASGKQMNNGVTLSAEGGMAGVGRLSGTGDGLAGNWGYIWIRYAAATAPNTPITVTAANKSMNFAAANFPTFTSDQDSHISGLVCRVYASTDTSYVTALTAAQVTTAGSPYKIHCGSATALSGYTISGYIDGTLTVNPAPITVTADDKSMTYQDSTFPSFTSNQDAHISGLICNVYASSDTGYFTALTPAQVTVSGSPYAIHCYGASSAADYSISGYTNGTLTVNARHVTVAATSTTVIAGSSPTFGTSQDSNITGLVCNVYTTSDVGYTTPLASSDLTPVGSPYVIHCGSATPNDGIVIDGYTDATLTVTPKPYYAQLAKVTSQKITCTPSSSVVVLTGLFENEVLAVALARQSLGAEAFSQTPTSLTLNLKTALTEATQVEIYNSSAVPLVVTIEPCTNVPSGAGHGTAKLTVYFGGDSSSISSATAAAIKKFVAKYGLKSKANALLAIVGYTKHVVGTSNDKKLSLARASQVLKFMKQLGFKASASFKGAGTSTLKTNRARQVVITVTW